MALSLSDLKEKLRRRIKDSEELNYLLGEEEFSDDDLEDALDDALAVWNEEPPLLTVYDTPDLFPWHTKLVKGAIGELYQMAAALYRRNHLSYQAGGVAVDDKNKFTEYERLQVQEISKAVVDSVRESMVCSSHCNDRMLKMNVKVGIACVLASISLGWKFTPLLIKMFIP